MIHSRFLSDAEFSVKEKLRNVWHAWDGNEEEPEEKKVEQQAQNGIQLNGRSQDLTLLLRLWRGYKKRPS